MNNAHPPVTKSPLDFKAPSTPATMSKQQATLSKQHSTLLPQTATMLNNSVVIFRPYDKVECFSDIVAVFGNNTGCIQ